MNKKHYAVVVNHAVIREEIAGFETPINELPRDEAGALLRRPLTVDESFPEGYDDDFDTLAWVYDIEAESVHRRYEAAPRDIGGVAARLKTRIDAIRDQMLANGFTYDGHRYQADAASMTRINTNAIKAMKAQADAGAFEMDWIDADNQPVALDATQMIALNDAASVFSDDIIKQARAHKDAIIALTDSNDAAGLRAYVITFS
ncbi:DUF4376 domain-containing protein [Thalassospira sp. TSL5-1]|uniref:DUF4376 domain-containing protein n=1 Tax=Thalassospira sp. TSL5-1 TaxID=1544451 RepID=UPI00093B6E03|nr:DUF4376 domain-containing protein [Thalassospira sp. TSL5-1]OKH88096.1 hypothetical protein LF95_15605 [Thalassospira sp. TSL5-1]